MSIQILCPSCNEVTEWHLPPVTACGRCSAPYPTNLRAASEAALRRSAAPKPPGLLLGQWLSALAGCVWTLLLVLAPFDAGAYSIEGETVSGPEFLRRAGFGMGLIAALFLAIAVGLMRDKAWSRPLMVAFWLAWPVAFISMGGFSAASLVPALVSSVVCAVLAMWYLYGSAAARAYFEARERPAPPEPPALP